MNKQSFVITVLTVCVSLTVTAQGAKDAEGTNPGWLWEISGNGLQQKSYIFSTLVPVPSGGDGDLGLEAFLPDGLDAVAQDVERHRHGAEPNDDLTIMCMQLV